MDTISEHTEGMAVRHRARIRRGAEDENIQQQPTGILDVDRLHLRGRGLPLSFVQSPTYIIWAAQLLNIDPAYFGNCATITVTGPKPAVAVYSNFNGINCEVTIAATGINWLKRPILRVLLAYPFRQLNCRRITLLISDSNQRTQKAAQHVGFVHEGYLREFLKNGDGCHIYSMTKKEYEESKYGRI